MHIKTILPTTLVLFAVIGCSPPTEVEMANPSQPPSTATQDEVDHKQPTASRDTTIAIKGLRISDKGQAFAPETQPFGAEAFGDSDQTTIEGGWHAAIFLEEIKMSRNIQDKVVIITGASSGLGEATARLLATQGATVVLAARRTDRLESLMNELKSQGAKAMAVTTDVTDRDQVKQLVDSAVQKYGRIDVMLNNAGLMQQSPLESLKLDEWDNMIDINIKGVLYGIAAALPVMMKQKSGHIINVSSVAGHKVTPAGTVYCATKHAVRAISEGLRQEVKPYNIRSTIISPGAVATELPSHITHEQSADGIQQFYEDFAIPADSFARCVEFAMSQPNDVDINEILFRPTSQEV